MKNQHHQKHRQRNYRKGRLKRDNIKSLAMRKANRQAVLRWAAAQHGRRGLDKALKTLAAEAAASGSDYRAGAISTTKAAPGEELSPRNAAFPGSRSACMGQPERTLGGRTQARISVPTLPGQKLYLNSKCQGAIYLCTSYS